MTLTQASRKIQADHAQDDGNDQRILRGVGSIDRVSKQGKSDAGQNRIAQIQPIVGHRCRRRAQFRLRVRSGDTWSEPGNDVDHEGRVAVDRRSTNRQVIGGNRRPDRRTAIVRPGKAARGHADDGESQAVQPDGPSDDCRI